MIMNKNNIKWLLLISVLSIIGFFAIFFSNISENPRSMDYNRPPFLPIENTYRQIPTYRILLSPILLIIGIIPISYYFISQKLEKKLENNIKVISRLINKNGVNSKKIIDKNLVLRFLNLNEKKILERLIEKNGKVLQSEISRMKGMTKLKTHRTIKNLERKGIIKRESYGKTYHIILSNDIKKLLLKQ